MKNKLFNKIIIITIIIFMLLLAIIIFYNHQDSINNKIDENNNTEVSKNVVYDTDGTILYDFEDEKLLNIAEAANTFDYLTIIYSISDYNTNEGIIQSKKPVKYIVSDINMIKGKDCTINSLELKEGEDPFKEPRLDFEEIFGFSYMDYDNTFDVMMKIAKESGINTDLENSTSAEFNEALFEDSKQELYVLNDEKLPIIQNILSTIEYDEILETVCTYVTVYNNNEKLNGYEIDYISATVTYKLNEEIKIREVKYKFGLHFDETGWK